VGGLLTNLTFRLEFSDAGFSRDPIYKGKGLQLEFTVEDEGVPTFCNLASRLRLIK
jgi:hypothetical protein